MNYSIEKGFTKIIITKTPYDVFFENKKPRDIVITPFSKMSSILSMLKSNILYKWIMENYGFELNEIINNEKFIKIIKNINEEIGIEYATRNDNIDKMVKSLIELVDLNIDNSNIENLLSFIDNNTDDSYNIYFIGFKVDLSHKIYNKVTPIFLMSKCNLVRWSEKNIEQLTIHKEDCYLEILCVDKFLQYIETEINEVIGIENLLAVLNGDTNNCHYNKLYANLKL